MKPTINDIANDLNLNISTVSRALKDNPIIKESTRKLVQDKALEMGYKPNLTAQHLAIGKTKTIWFILGDYGDKLQQVPVQVVSKLAQEYGLHMLSALHHHDYTVLESLLDRMSQGACDGAIIIPPFESSKDFSHSLLHSDFPLVCLDRKISKLPLVSTHNQQAVQKLIQHCHDQGCTDYVNLFNQHNSVEDTRYKATIKYLKELNLTEVSEKIKYRTWKQNEKPLAIVSTSPYAVQGFIEKYNIKNPIFLCSFDIMLPTINNVIQHISVLQDFEAIAKKSFFELHKILQTGIKKTRAVQVPPLKLLIN